MASKYAFAQSLKEVRFLFCQTSEQSAAVRLAQHSRYAAGKSFINRAYPTMKKNNPTIPILVREAQGTIPKVYARYGTTLLRIRKIGVGNSKLMAATTDFGTEKSQSLEGLSDKQVEDAVAGLVKDGP
ncbi:unnamed protein product [Clonostachys rhizophaga]|uniref:Ribosomal protein/NADH dehydrogenase domain-containing protein n=1 Tax=Clonostachys rhizophaga TaxID=160324 RepID=A0A9N9YE79_9HYPO|nr:unnamed protein product [Clonostachys rhizophaga]